MLKLEQITDPETLRQTASLLEKTVIRQQKEIARLSTEIAQLKGMDPEQSQPHLTALEEQLSVLRREVFGASSERRPRKDESDQPTPARTPKRGHGPREQPALPIQVTDHVLAEDDRVCHVCGGRLEELAGQREESREITVVELRYFVNHHRRQKYVCQCNGTVVTCPGPDKLIPGGRYSPEFAVHLAERKYLDHMPLARQQRDMQRKGLNVESQTLWDQLDAAGRHLEPTWHALHEYVLGADLVYCDETYWRLMDQAGSSRWWAWCVASDDAVAYRILRRRSHKAAREVLRDYDGIVVTDGFSAYDTLQRAGPAFTHVHCWAHVRRKFIDSEGSYPNHSSHAVDLIGKLFEVEREAPRLGTHAPYAERRERLDLLARLRTEKSRPAIDELRQWAYDTLPTVLPQSNLAKAINYMLGLWPGLIRFLDDPQVPLTNNLAERSLRGPVIGRKNHHGSRSQRGTEVAAIFYSLFESAKLAGVDPHGYVLTALRRAIRRPGAITLPADLQN